MTLYKFRLNRYTEIFGLEVHQGGSLVDRALSAGDHVIEERSGADDNYIFPRCRRLLLCFISLL